MLVSLHPGCSVGASALNQLTDHVEIIPKVPGEDRFVVGNSVAQQANPIQGIEHPKPIARDGCCRREIRENCPHERHPETAIVTTGEHPLPEYELQLGDHLPGSCLAVPR